MRLGLVYLPPANVASIFTRFAETLTRDKEARVVLGPNKLAHLSLLHVETEEAPESLWRDAKATVPLRAPIEIFSLGLHGYHTPYNAPSAGPASIAWLMAYCSPALRAAEESALTLPFVNRARVTTHNGDQFQPHFTIAIWEGAPGAITAFPSELTNVARFEGRLALGQIGPNGVYERTMFEG